MTTNEQTAEVPEPHRARLAKFIGSRSSIKVELWLNLFEVETHGQTDTARIASLMRYLSDDGLNFYATDIATHMDAMSWTDARKLMTDRFGIAIRHPLVEANKRFLKYSETIQEYYEDKLRLLRLAGLDNEASLALLTDGVPVAYRSHLACCPATTPVEWLKHALRLEATANSNRRPQTDQSFTKALLSMGNKTRPQLIRRTNSVRNNFTANLPHRAVSARMQARQHSIGTETVIDARQQPKPLS